MKNYSFSNITNEQSFGTRRSSDLSVIYRHSQLKGSQASQRIDQIKKKYDTPSRKQRIESLKKSKEQQLLNRALKQQPKENAYIYKPSPNFGNNHLKQSFAVNRLQKSTLNKNDFDNRDFMNMKPIDRNDRDFRRGVNDKENMNVGYKAVFSKVREMKQSILNNNYIKTAIGARPIKYDKYQGKRQFDPRVENIDKINSKIKQILSCLSENQKNPKYNKDVKEVNTASFVKDEVVVKQPPFFGVKVKQVNQSNSKSYGHGHKNSDVVEKYNILDSQQSKEIAEPSNKPDSYRSKSYFDSNKIKLRDYSATKIEQPISKEYQPTRKTKGFEEIIRTPTYPNKDLKGSKSKSHIDSNKNSMHNQNGDVLKSGKKLNDEISRIQKKIEQFQKQKRKLNIQFTPFTLKNKSTANLAVSFNGDKPTAQSKNVKESLKNSEESSKNSLNHRSSSYDIKFKSYMNRAANYQQKYLNLTNIHSKQVTKNTSIYERPKQKFLREGGDFQLKIHQIQVKNVQIQKEVQHNEDESIKQSMIQFDEAAIKKRTDDGIEERRKIWKRQEDIITTQTIKNIVKLFCEQVKLDQNLRNLKIWLQSSFQSDKFSKILKFLQRQGFSMNSKQCKTTFTLDQSENNPFFSVQSFQGNYQALALAYLDAQNHWKNKILHKFSRNSLSSQGFSSQKIDLQRKGYIQLEDLVRFLNIQSGTFYRNRDLFLIFRRFTPTDKLNFENLLSQICA